jgi:hypothetical protein
MAALYSNILNSIRSYTTDVIQILTKLFSILQQHKHGDITEFVGSSNFHTQRIYKHYNDGYIIASIKIINIPLQYAPFPGSLLTKGGNVCRNFPGVLVPTVLFCSLKHNPLTKVQATFGADVMNS